MSVRGIQDDDGSFERETLDEIEQRFIERAREQLGTDVDLSQGSPIKQLIDVVVLETDYMWQLLEDTYYSAYYGHAYEEQLDKLLELSQFDRIPRRGATGEVMFTAQTANTSDVIIPEGTRVATYETEDRPSIPYKTTEPARLEAGRNYVSNVGIRACEPWETDISDEWLGEETNVASNTIEVFQTPIQGIDHVTNPHPTGDQSYEQGYSFMTGRDRENDTEFRQRFESQIGVNATASLDALRSSVLALDGVRSADIDENTSMQDNTSSGGLPPKSFRLTILGDEDSDSVAQEIVDTRSAGIQSYGFEKGQGETSDGELRDEYFDRSDEIDIYVDVTVTHDGTFDADGSLQVENAIIDYIGGERADGSTVSGTSMGEDIVFDMVFKQAINTTGVWQVDLDIGIDPNDLKKGDITIDEQTTGMVFYQDINVFTEEKTIP